MCIKDVQTGSYHDMRATLFCSIYLELKTFLGKVEQTLIACMNDPVHLPLSVRFSSLRI